MGRPRDPVSVDYSAAAARALGRALARPGRWVTITVARPSARRFIAYYRQGIDVLGGDGNTPPVNRSVRGMIRALYYERRGVSQMALVWRGGEQTTQGWEVQIMVAPHGDPRLPPPKPAFTDPAADPGTANPANRDW